MCSHVYFGTNDIKNSKAFYDAVLPPLGYSKALSYPTGIMHVKAEGGSMISITPNVEPKE